VNDIQFVASSTRGRGSFTNIGRTRRQGFEASVRVQRGGWRLGATYAFIDATFRLPVMLSSPANPLANDDGEIAVEAGDRLTGLPRHSATRTADYEGRIGSRAFAIGGDMIARSGLLLFGDEANQNPEVSGYVLFNLRGRIELAQGVAVFGELRNVFNRDFATFGTVSEVEAVELVEAPTHRIRAPSALARRSACLSGWTAFLNAARRDYRPKVQCRCCGSCGNLVGMAKET
jgi:outer membrane receptor protein involved in Fe transport